MQQPIDWEAEAARAWGQQQRENPTLRERLDATQQHIFSNLEEVAKSVPFMRAACFIAQIVDDQGRHRLQMFWTGDPLKLDTMVEFLGEHVHQNVHRVYGGDDD